MTPSLKIETARSSDWVEALALAFQHFPAHERDTRVLNAISLIEKGELDGKGIFVAWRQAQLAGVLVCLPTPGAAALVWPPHSTGKDRSQVEDALLRHGNRWLQSLGVKLAQTVLARDQVDLATPLLRNEFRHITTLLYLRHGLSQRRAPTPILDFETYSTCSLDVFVATLERTYEDTLDCPEINGVRNMDEILAGHRAQGIHNPEHWWLARRHGKPVGVVLAARISEWEGWDLSYVGVVPEARGQGFGRQLTTQALLAAHQEGANELTLSVDRRNLPARNVYRRLGFRLFEEREVYLAIWKK
jgi:ribosomal protein S18 acetylase RimI-like enzyme